ncbi:recombinase family protein [Candidatus Omnitrophota bacterium]
MAKIQALYSRVSTDMQREKNFSVPRQKKWLDEKAKQLGFKNTKHYTDNGYSATDSDRPAYSRLIENIGVGLVDTVLVYKNDRIARGIRDLITFLDLLSNYGVKFISITENFNTSTPTGNAMMMFAGVLAQWERDMVVERVKDAMWDMARAGKFCGGQPPYGYDVKDKNLVPNKEQADILNQMFRMFPEKKSFRSIVHWLNKQGYTTKRGTSFAQSTIRRYLTNPIYRGYFTYGKRAGNSKKVLPKEEWLTIKGSFEPIISEELFDQVQAIIRQRDYVRQDLTGEVYLLSGLIRCGQCGGRMAGSYAQKENGKRYFYYKCHNHDSKGESICEGNTVRRDYIEEQVLEEVNSYAIQFEEGEAKNIMAHHNTTNELKRINATISSLERKQNKALDLALDGALPKKLLVKRMDELTEDLDRAKLQKDRLTIEAGNHSRNKRVNVLERVNQLNGKLKTLPRTTQKEILRQLIKEIRYYKTGEIEIEKYEL